MTIRKRFDEAQILINNDLHEPALVLLLVATAAASERLRKHETNSAPKGRGDDGKWFAKYVSAELPRVLYNDANGKKLTAADALYKDLRCELIHEAQPRAGAFTDHQFLMSINNGRFAFGLGLLQTLSALLISDPLGRDEFRDILHPFQNLIEFAGQDTEEYTRTKIIADRGLTPGRYEILLRIITALTPERLASLTHGMMASVFARELLPELYCAKLNGGALTGLRMTDGDPILDQDNSLTVAGSDILRQISSNYRTIDLAKP